MLSKNQYNLTWDHFAQINGDKHIVFENLCRALFKRTLCMQDAILHSNPNNPGVEVEPVLDKSGICHISFQAKYFETNVAYSQIKHSAEETIRHYRGNIEKVYLYSNKDISTSSKQYLEIVQMLADEGIEIVLITGQTILDQVSEYPYILATYFGINFLDSEWFNANLKLSLDNLGKRYNARFNIDTNAQEKIEIFLRENTGICRINQKKAELANELKNVLLQCNDEERKYVQSIRRKVLAIVDITAKNVSEALLWKETLKELCKDELSALGKIKESITSELTELSHEDKKCELFRNSLYRIDHIYSLLDTLDFSTDEESCINSKVLIVKGAMGTGKTQLLASTAKRLSDNGNIVLLYLGQTFTSSEDIEKQMIGNLQGLNVAQSLESLMCLMEEASVRTDKDSVIFIDAINESYHREIWKHGINKLIALINQFKHVRLVLSIRNGFEKLTLSDKVIEDSETCNDGIATIIHNGLMDFSLQAVYDFLSNYGVPFSPEYYLQADMSNPLFLTWFCQTYSGDEPDLLLLVKKVIENADLEASQEAGNKEPFGAMESLLNAIVSFRNEATDHLLTKEEILQFSVWDIYGIKNKVAYLKAAERYGVISTYIVESNECYYPGYNLLEEFLSAKQLLDTAVDEQCAKVLIKDLLFKTVDGKLRLNYSNVDVFTMAMSLCEKKYGHEPIEILDDIDDEYSKRFLLDHYFNSIARRSNFSFDCFLSLIRKYNVAPQTVWDVFIENATKKHSEINANGLNRLLQGYELNKRDYLWTTRINTLNEDDRIVSLAYFIEAGNDFSANTESVQLLLTLFAWMLSSSNRVLRDRVSKAMIEILKDRFQLCLPLLQKFSNVNDPYIIQRLYGIIFGAVMKRSVKYSEEYKRLTEWILCTVFDVEKVYPDILLRDYARLIIERFAYEFPAEAKSLKIIKARPPYVSDPIPMVDPIDYGKECYNVPGVASLIFSMTFDSAVKGRGLYGDFGRYTFQSALSSFKNINLDNIFYYSLSFIFNELGYTSELFGEYDTQIINRSRHDCKKIERIGKKYQWIAMYNILARIADINKVECWWDWSDKNGTDYSGPWEPYVRDFDPTLNGRYGINPSAPSFRVPNYGMEEFLDFDAADDLIKSWVSSKSKVFSDYPKRLFLNSDDGTEWISLYHYYEAKVRPQNIDDIAWGFPNGEQKIWTLATAYFKSSMNGDGDLKTVLDEKMYTSHSHEVRNSYSLYSREYAWSPGFNDQFMHVEGDDSELNDISPSVMNMLWEEEYDASQDESTSFFIPAGDIIKVLNLKEKKYDGYYYSGDDLVAFDLLLSGYQYHEFVIRKDFLQRYLKKTASTLFWTLVGEKQFFCGGHDQIWKRWDGIFIFDGEKIHGDINISNKK